MSSLSNLFSPTTSNPSNHTTPLLEFNNTEAPRPTVPTGGWVVVFFKVNERDEFIDWYEISPRTKAVVLFYAILGFCLCASVLFRSKHWGSGATATGSGFQWSVLQRRAFLTGSSLLNLLILMYLVDPKSHDAICTLRMLAPLCFSMTFLNLMWIFFTNTPRSRQFMRLAATFVMVLLASFSVTTAVISFVHPPKPINVLHAWGTDFRNYSDLPHSRQYASCSVDIPRVFWRFILAVEIAYGLLFAVVVIHGNITTSGGNTDSESTAAAGATQNQGLAIATLSFCHVGYIVLNLTHHPSNIRTVDAFFICVATALSSALLVPTRVLTTAPEPGNQDANSTRDESLPLPGDDLELHQDSTQKDTAQEPCMMMVPITDETLSMTEWTSYSTGDDEPCELVWITDDAESATEQTSQSTSSKVETERQAKSNRRKKKRSKRLV